MSFRWGKGGSGSSLTSRSLRFGAGELGGLASIQRGAEVLFALRVVPCPVGTQKLTCAGLRHARLAIHRGQADAGRVVVVQLDHVAAHVEPISCIAFRL